MLAVSIVMIATVQGASTSKGGGTLTYVGDFLPAMTDPRYTPMSKFGHTIMFQIMQPLVAYDPDGKLIPVLALSWKASPDNKEFVFKLRKLIKFHNGKEFTSEDVIAAFDVVLGKIKTKVPITVTGTNYANLKDVVAVDKYTVKFTLPKPAPVFPALLATWLPSLCIQPKEDYENPEAVTKPIGTGPYKFVEYVLGERLVLERNKNYWGGPYGTYYGDRPYIDKVVCLEGREESSRVMALLSGNADLLYEIREVQNHAQIKNNPSLQLMKVNAPRVKSFVFNQRYYPFNNLDVRKAVAMGIDWDKVAAAMFDGENRKLDLFGDTKFALADINSLVYKYNPEEAKRLIAKVKAEFGPIKASNLYAPTDPQVKMLAEYFKSELPKLGIDEVELIPVMAEKGTYFRNTAPGTWQTNILYVESGQADPYIPFPTIALTPGPYPDGKNTLGYVNPAVDKLIDQAMATRDSKVQIKCYQDALRQLYRDVVFIPITAEPIFMGANNKIQNLRMTAFYRTQFTLAGVWLKK